MNDVIYDWKCNTLTRTNRSVLGTATATPTVWTQIFGGTGIVIVGEDVRTAALHFRGIEFVCSRSGRPFSGGQFYLSGQSNCYFPTPFVVIVFCFDSVCSWTWNSVHSKSEKGTKLHLIPTQMNGNRVETRNIGEQTSVLIRTRRR
jgi:hypothetical protein